jgi:hypothetical protein
MRVVTAGSMLLLSLTACAEELGAPEALPDVDAEAFAVEVYPILLRDCAMSQCHGAPERFFRVVGPGRVRLSEHTGPLEPATAAEVRLSLTRARSMLERSASERPLLLRKPLALDAGGATHEGSDRYGRNVYLSRSDPSYVAIERWADRRGGER